MGVKERKFCRASKRCVWKEVYWRLYEEGRGSEWWNEGVKMKVEEKRMAFE